MITDYLINKKIKYCELKFVLKLVHVDDQQEMKELTRERD